MVEAESYDDMVERIGAAAEFSAVAWGGHLIGVTAPGYTWNRVMDCLRNRPSPNSDQYVIDFLEADRCAPCDGSSVEQVATRRQWCAVLEALTGLTRDDRLDDFIALLTVEIASQ